jgi:hypothetical protein
MEKISWTDRVRNEVKEERNILHTIKRNKANWIGHILHRNCLMKHVIEGEIGGTGWSYWLTLRKRDDSG